MADYGTGEERHEHEPTPELLADSPVRVAVLDMHGQYVGLIGKATERLGYPTDILPHNTPIEVLEREYSAVILSGSPANSYEEEELRPDPRIWESDIPKLGICHGLHVAITDNGGIVERGATRQDGVVKTDVDIEHPLFNMVKKEQEARFTHGNFVREVPEGFDVIGEHAMADGSLCISAVSAPHLKYVGVQFHPEVFDDAPEGYTVIKNFLQKVAKLDPDEAFYENLMEQRIEQKRAEIRERVGDDHVVAYLSGGVDSSVAAALAAGVIAPEKFHAYFFDTGFMRIQDEEVVEMLTAAGIAVQKIDAIDFFANATKEIDGVVHGPLSTVSDPEIRRKIKGKAFIDYKAKILEELGLSEAILLDGSNAADIVETLRGIVSHHNQVEEALQENPLQPLNDLFKDEIRGIGRILGLPLAITERDPFPGPGTLLGIVDIDKEPIPLTLEDELNVCLSELTGDYSEAARGLVLPIKSAGVAGDERTYLNVAALPSGINWENIPYISEQLTNRFRDNINRVIVPIGQNIGTDFTITPKDFDVEREIERFAHEIVRQERAIAGVNWVIEQCPVITFPLSFDGEGKRSVAIRPITTATYMTAEALIPGVHLPEDFARKVARRIITEMPNISTVFWDVTGKPPGRTEWM